MTNISDNKCTKGDYRRLFAEAAEPLRELCYMLTSNVELSDKILEAALEQSLKGAETVFRNWMLSWARRLVIKACIEIVRPWASPLGADTYPLSPLRLDATDHGHLSQVFGLPSEVFLESLRHLDALSRFVFVLRAMEGYSRHETSLLLNIDDRLCDWVHVRAAQRLEEDAKPIETPVPTPFPQYELALAGD
ncbi:MAG TPA: hypothetical protein VLT90_06585 [Terriglobales bacterium]|nr:hypothetical protein [Terriglobales bacterium]